MTAPAATAALAAAVATAVGLGLRTDDAIVLQDSNALTVRLLPCDVVARVTRATHGVAQPAFELALARGLAARHAPVARPDPRAGPQVHEHDGFAITFWTHYPPTEEHAVAPSDYAHALEGLHAGMRGIDAPVPHFTDRVLQAQRLIAAPERTPHLGDAERDLLARTLRRSRRTIADHGADEQLLHGEPHPGNVLSTADGPLFIDWETCCRGPVEFDLAHAPPDVDAHYRAVDPDLLIECRILVLAMITAWRWDRDDRLPDGRRLGRQWFAELGAALERAGRR